MNIEYIQSLLRQKFSKKETYKIEFKEVTQDKLPKSLFETICAMLNSAGGDILLGVKDNGEIIGVNPQHIDKLLTNFASSCNSEEKINPTIIASPEKYIIDNKVIIHIKINESSDVHYTCGKYYQRRIGSDGDYKLNASQIQALYNRRSNIHSENKIYPYVTMHDFKSELFNKVRNLMRGNEKIDTNRYISSSDEDLLKILGFYRDDKQNGEKGYTLASVLIFGKDELISSILPYEFDMFAKIRDISRWDDRETITGNLIEAFEKSMAFIAKHLPDRFDLEGIQRISRRDIIFREVIANMLVHRDYNNLSIKSMLTIYADKIETINANKITSNVHGKINLNNYLPIEKNAHITQFFRLISRMDKAGTGLNNIRNHIKYYSPNSLEPEFFQDEKLNLFKSTIYCDNVLIKNNINEAIEHKNNHQLDLFNSINDKTAGGNDKTAGGNDKTAGGNDKTAGGNDKTAGGNDKTAGGNDKTAGGNDKTAGISLKNNLIELLNIISSDNGINIHHLSIKLNRSSRTLERHIKKLKELNLIETKILNKQQGYYIKDNNDS